MRVSRRVSIASFSRIRTKKTLIQSHPRKNKSIPCLEHSGDAHSSTARDPSRELFRVPTVQSHSIAGTPESWQRSRPKTRTVEQAPVEHVCRHTHTHERTHARTHTDAHAQRNARWRPPVSCKNNDVKYRVVLDSVRSLTPLDFFVYSSWTRELSTRPDSGRRWSSHERDHVPPSLSFTICIDMLTLHQAMSLPTHHSVFTNIWRCWVRRHMPTIQHV